MHWWAPHLQAGEPEACLVVVPLGVEALPRRVPAPHPQKPLHHRLPQPQGQSRGQHAVAQSLRST